MVDSTQSDAPKPPAALGYAMPAEWERHEATWLAWPHCRTDWPGKLPSVRWAYGEIVRRLADGEFVRMLVNSADDEARARDLLAKAHADSDRVQFFRIPTDRGWARDYGPIFVRRPRPAPRLAVARFRFNAWAKRRRNWGRDDRVAERAAAALGLPVLPIARPDGAGPFVLEGGAVDVNGRGAVLTTEQCLLHTTVQVRNAGLSRNQVAQTLADSLGAPHVLWLGDGVAGDDTHGHVDDLCRFVNPTTVVAVVERNPRDVNYRPLAANRERLAGLRLEDGSKLNVVELPMPQPLHFAGLRLPASYANFYIANAAVIVPTFNDPADRVALGRLADLFGNRPVVGIHAVDLVLGFGAIHCLTQQQPAG